MQGRLRTTRENCSAGEIGQNFGIVKMTISDHITGKQMGMKDGPEPYVLKQLKDEIVAWLIKMAHIGCGQMKEQLFNKVQELVMHLNIKHHQKITYPYRCGIAYLWHNIWILLANNHSC